MRPLVVRTEIDGFIADRLMEALWREALWLVADDVATVAEIDSIHRAILRGPIEQWRLEDVRRRYEALLKTVTDLASGDVLFAATGVTDPGAATSSDAIDVEVDGAAPATNPTFPLNNGSYDNTTWNPGCATAGICGTVTDTGSGVAQVSVAIKDRTTGKYWGGTAFDQSSQTFLAASLAGTNWSYALDQSELTAPHAYLVELFSTDNVSNAETHQQIRFTYGSDTGAPTTTLSLTGATNAYLTGAPYVLYYGTTLGSGGFTLHASSTDPSGVDTIAFPDLSGTTGFSSGS